MRMLANDEWAEAQFREAALGDVRRVRRAVRLAAEMLSKPGASIPQLSKTRYDVKAAYNLFAHSESTPENLQAGHRLLVHAALHDADSLTTRLLVEDTTTMSWPADYPIAGLAPIGEMDALSQGFLLHSVLAMSWASPGGNLPGELPGVLPGVPSERHPPLSLLGVASQQFVLREMVPESEAALPEGSRHFARQKREDRESDLWLRSTSELGPAPLGVRWVRICDRGADIYEFLRSALSAGHGFVVRAAQDRALLEDGEAGHRLFERVRAEGPVASLTIELRSRPGKPARGAALSVSACAVVIRSPRRPGASPGKLEPIHCTAIRAWEEKPPEGEKPLEWILLTDVGPLVGTLDAGRGEEDESAIAPLSPLEAVECVLQYATRWVIEEFHKVLKTGLGAERLQLEQADRLFAAIALMSVVAVRLLDLKERVRAAPHAPAESSGVDPLSITLLERHVGRRLETVQDVVLAIGRLGGHMGRKRDGLPGWKTLWLGLRQLDAMTHGARLALQLQSRFG
jgi:hypothetical protein